MSRYRKQDKGGGLFSAIDHQKAVALKSTGVLKLRDTIDWNSFRPLMEDISGYATHDWSKGGKPPFDPVFMLKILVLQKYFNLSDDATEEQIFDALAFRTSSDFAPAMKCPMPKPFGTSSSESKPKAATDQLASSRHSLTR